MAHPMDPNDMEDGYTMQTFDDDFYDDDYFDDYFDD
jgi:hypothetical protein